MLSWELWSNCSNLSKSMHMAILNSFCLNLLLESHRDLLIVSQLLRPIIIHVLLQLGDVKVFMHSCDLPVQLTSVSILKSSSCGANLEVSQCFHLWVPWCIPISCFEYINLMISWLAKVPSSRKSYRIKSGVSKALSLATGMVPVLLLCVEICLWLELLEQAEVQFFSSSVHSVEKTDKEVRVCRKGSD